MLLSCKNYQLLAVKVKYLITPSRTELLLLKSTYSAARLLALKLPPIAVHGPGKNTAVCRLLGPAVQAMSVCGGKGMWRHDAEGVNDNVVYTCIKILHERTVRTAESWKMARVVFKHNPGCIPCFSTGRLMCVSKDVHSVSFSINT